MTAVPVLRRVYWETTAGCNLECIHCRRIDVSHRVSADEITTAESRALIDDLAAMGKPVLILSGGEPLFRRDIFDIASYAHGLGLPVALSTNGTLVTAAIAEKIRDSGVYYASISLDGAHPKTHDSFRGPGNFERAIQGLKHMRKMGVKVQINFTVTRQNVGEMREVYELARSLDAHALYLFLLVPVGCGIQIADAQMLGSAEVEEWLKWVADLEAARSKPEVRAICAPQFYRVKSQLEAGRDGGPRTEPEKRLGCLAAINICFISHKGDVFPCGYLPVSAGNVRQTPLSKIWENSALFHKLRNEEFLEGKCSLCDYKTLCGGCRARAFYQFGSEFAEEPFCDYEPAGKPSPSAKTVSKKIESR
ncbi:MAG: hypothetical protein A2902_06955 [Elusimicrobia bacterium RIFCSPLOWO2_01_FULL_64_13]|nr:MAG: hypothetical protein A2636_04180 [Elusimicrobia bacterium RIFCSPHIGHO2_01_FULL_64_10]OGR97472.1 MAG: hypothetical protein A2902_06955 [Elusimicrobia bacterium RIFCSPLOWO2_01_FULL_64_13]